MNGDAAILIAEERKPVRWADYDYSSAGVYFITINEKHRHAVFGSVMEGELVHSAAGLIAARCLQEIHDHFPMVTVDCSVVMPDHIHAMFVVSSGPFDSSDSFVGIGHARSLRRTDRTGRTDRPFETIPVVVGSFKSAVSRLVRQTELPSFQWQKSYHDRIIRDNGELERIRAYIHDNPRRWWEKRVAGKDAHACFLG